MVHHPHNEMTKMPKMPNVPKEPKHPIGFGKFGRFGTFGTFELGSVSVEMVFFLLIFVVTFFGAIEMAREVSVKHALDVGAYRAARYLSIVPADQATALNMIQSELDRNVLGGAGTVQMNVDMPSQTFQSIFSVTAQVAYQPVIPLMVFAPKTLQVTHSQSIEAYP
jgi:Flp pilus assembly protein TadG